MDRRKIWIFNHHATTPDVGMSTRHYDFAKELVKRGYELTIFSSSYIHYKNINILENESYDVRNVDGINWVYINTIGYKSNGLRRILGMFNYYNKVLSISKNMLKPDIVIGSSVHLLACLAAYRVGKRQNIPFVSEIRDLWPETLIQMGRLKRNSFIVKLLNILEDFIYKKSDAIIITAPGMKKYIEKRIKDLDNSKIVYINNGIDINAFDHIVNGQCNVDDICLDKGYFNVVYAGAHGLANGLETAIEAAKILQNKNPLDYIRFIFLGDGSLKKQLVEKSKVLKLRNVVFYNTISKRMVPKVLNQADVLLLMGKNIDLYKYGISSNKLFEYMCAGKPIVFAINAINDYVATENCGISIEPEDPIAMANALVKLYELDIKVREEMGYRGRLFVEKNFSIPLLVDKLEFVLNKKY